MLCISAGASANTTDSLLNVYRQIRSGAVTGQVSSIDTKCCFALAAGLKLTMGLQEGLTGKPHLTELFSRPGTDTSIISPRGFFRIHYRFDEANRPLYDINAFAAAADSAYVVQTQVYGFLPPPPDFGAGGDDRYDIYIYDIGMSYGYTEPERELQPGSQTYSSYICIKNDFSQFYTKGLNAAKVTIAHELHHAIQMGNYILRHNGAEILDRFFYELTSTSMEEYVFPDINDYYQYLQSFFDYPERSFVQHSGYNLVIWNLFLTQKFGNPLLVRIWENFRTLRALPATDLALNSTGSSFKDALSEFSVWCFYSGFRSAIRRYFPESERYPALKIQSLSPFVPPVSNFTPLLTNACSINPVKISNSAWGRNDTVVILATNNDIAGSVSSPVNITPVTPSLATQSKEGYTQLSDLYYLKMSSPNLNFLTSRTVINNIETGTVEQETADSYVYPNPLILDDSRYRCVIIPLSQTEQDKEVELAIFNASMDRVYTGRKATFFAGTFKVQWFPEAESSTKISTGVYFYLLKTRGGTKSGKFTIVVK